MEKTVKFSFLSILVGSMLLSTIILGSLACTKKYDGGPVLPTTGGWVYGDTDYGTDYQPGDPRAERKY